MTNSDWIAIVSAFVAFVSVVVSIIIYNKQKYHEESAYLYNRLRDLQGLALKYPFLEDADFIKQWDTLKSKTKNATATEEEHNNLLRYDAYTEMLFNYVVFLFMHFKTEEKVLQFIDLKSWLRPHKTCWENPLTDHSNRDAYGDEICDVIDKWMK